MFRVTESEKQKPLLPVTFLLGCVFFGTCTKQRRRQQRMAGNSTLLPSTGNTSGVNSSPENVMQMAPPARHPLTF